MTDVTHHSSSTSPSSKNNASSSADNMIGSLGDAFAGVTLSTTGTTAAAAAAGGTVVAGGAVAAGGGGVATTPTPPTPTTTTSTSVTSGGDHQQKEGLDLFLSRSPSQMIGNDVFKQLNSTIDPTSSSSTNTTSLPGLSIPDGGVGVGSGGVRPVISAAHSASFDQQPASSSIHHHQQQQQQQRNSPSSSNVTGTTTASTATMATGRSRSNSPYEGPSTTTPHHHTIQAYNNNNNTNNTTPAPNPTTTTTTGGHGSIGTPSSSVATSSLPQVVQPTGFVSQQQHQHQHQQQPDHHYQQQQQQPQLLQQAPQVMMSATTSVPPMQQDPQQQQQQQVLYMMVPTPDGRGQVLQPMQMVQMPNKSFAYVMPGMNPNMNMAATAGPHQMGLPPQPPMMVMMGPGQQQQQQQVGMVVPGGGGTAAASAQQAVPQMLHQQQPHMAAMPQSSAGVSGATSSQPPPPSSSQQQQQQQNPIGMVGGQNLLSGGNPILGGGRNLNGGTDGTGITYGSAALGGPSTDEYSSPSVALGLDGTAVGIDLSQYATAAVTGGGGGSTDLTTMASPYGIAAPHQRPTLDTLLGHIRRLSRDQVGCRMVQQVLDLEGPMAATLILQEGLPFWGEAMIDPFGNYLFQKILEKVTREERVVLIKSVSTRLVNASLNLHGTRSVQKIVEMCALDEEETTTTKLPMSPDTTPTTTGEETAADVLTKALAPSAARLCIDSHGNHVIQRILLKLDPRHSQFVFDAVAEGVGDVARHRHGCCVIQRCLDSPTGSARSNLVRRIVDKSLELMQDAYGNYVVQYVLDVCSDEDVHAVCESVVGKVNLLAIQKFSSNVMEKCLERCTDRVKEQYMQELSDPERIRELMMDPFGNYVVQRALTVATHAQAIRLVEAMRPHLMAQTPGTPNGQRNGGVRNTAGGRRIMAKICRRFPNFSLSTGGTAEEIYSQNRSRHHPTNRPNTQMNAGPVYGIAAMTPQGVTQIAPQMNPIAPGPIQQRPHVQQQHLQQPIQQPQQQQNLYADNSRSTDFSSTNVLGMNGLGVGGLQFDQQQQPQPFYNVGAADSNSPYFQQNPQMGHNGGYSTGL